MNAPLAHAQTFAAAANPRAVLLLANEFVAQYRVLRCAAMIGARVYVMGPEKARALALSRYCAGYRACFFGHEAYLRSEEQVDVERIAAEVDAYAREQGVEMILPCDHLTTRLLAAMRPYLKTPSFPGPSVETFDKIATKDAFMAFCRARNLLHPEGRIFETVDDLRAAVDAGQVRFPAMLKPVNRAGSIGVVPVDKDTALQTIARLDYAPILAQDFVAGEDRSITVTAINGAISKEVVYWHPDGIFHFGGEPELSAIVANIVRELNLSGVYNFDARIGTDGRVWMIECNPRFFFNMDVVAVAGMNFAALDDVIPGIRIALAHDDMRVPQATLGGLLRGRVPDANDIKMVKHWLDDPLVFALISAGFPRRWRPRWLEALAAHIKR